MNIFKICLGVVLIVATITFILEYNLSCTHSKSIAEVVKRRSQ